MTSPRDLPERCLLTREVADRYRVSRQQVYAWIRDGDLHAVDIGNGYRFRPCDLEDFEARKWGNPSPQS